MLRQSKDACLVTTLLSEAQTLLTPTQCDIRGQIVVRVKLELR